jgi:crotonobetainyl-CoA:carnitine CoA-transferase CaiB-like acyl-CoA transferase
MVKAESPKALAGLRILDLSHFWAGPSLTEFLGDLGADVIKVESTRMYDRWRSIQVPGYDAGDAPFYETGPYFNTINRNKRGITLDLRSEAGVEILKALVPECDVVVENFTPRVMPAFGLDYPQLRELREDLIMISLPGFGSTGPWKDYVSYAWPTESTAGFPALTGYRDGPPMYWGQPGADAIAGMVGAFAVLSALEYRRQTGRGQYIDVSQVELLGSFLGSQMIDYYRHGTVPERSGNRHPHFAPHGVFPAAGEDRWVAVAVTDDEQWQGLCECLGRTDWSARAELARAPGRKAAEDELEEGVAAWTRRHGDQEGAELLQAAGVPAGALLTVDRLVADPHFVARGSFVRVDREYVGEHPIQRTWARFSVTPDRIERPAPTLGQHTNEVLRELLGVPDDDLARLEQDGVTGTSMPEGSLGDAMSRMAVVKRTN